MSEIKEYVAHLSQTIGPRPAGTEEEQQAALYIAESLQTDASLNASLEDFNCNPDYGLVKATCGAVAAVMALLAAVFSVMVVPALIVSVLAAALFVAESMGKPVASKLFNRGVSQNVVAKCEPAGGESSRRKRKIVLVAHYDSGKIQKGMSAPILAALPFIRWAELSALVAIPVLLVIRLLSSAEGALLTVLTVLLVVALVLALLPFVSFILGKVSSYNEGANCNAAGVAVMMEVAARVGNARAFRSNAAPGDGSVVVHGEADAVARGLVPKGAELVYDVPADPNLPVDDSPQARLLAAKAAVAALSGKPVSNTINIDISDKLVQVGQPPIAEQDSEGQRVLRAEIKQALSPSDEANFGEADSSNWGTAGALQYGAEGAAAVEGAVAGVVSDGASAAAAVAARSGAGASSGAAAFGQAPRAGQPSGSVPSWYKSAQEKARKPTSSAPIHRSRYADALDAAEREREQGAALPAQPPISEAERRLQSMRDSILEAQAADFAQEDEILALAQEGQIYSPENAIGESASCDVRAGVSEPEAMSRQATGVGGFLSSATASSGYQASQPGRVGAVTMREAEEAVGTSYCGQGSPSSQQMSPSAPQVRVVDAAALDGNDGALSSGIMPPSGSETPVFAGASASASSFTPASVSAPSPSPAPSPDRTIAFIPVAVDGASLGHGSADLSQSAASYGERGDLTGGSTAEKPSSQVVQTQAADLSSPQRGQQREPRKRRAMALPSLTGSLKPLDEHKQNAPLASLETRSHALRAALPSVNSRLTVDALEAGGTTSGATSGAASGLMSDATSSAASGLALHADKSSLRSSLPSLSGIIAGREIAGADDQASATVSVNQAGSFASSGATGAFSPVGAELVDDVSPDEMYVDDADDSAYEDHFTETGAFAGPGYVDMPKSRASRFFGKLGFGRKKNQPETSTREWLDVDDSFDAREVGKARGGWESFRDDADSYDAPDEYGNYGEYDDYDAYDKQDAGFADDERAPRWNGGGFSRESLTQAFGRFKKSGSSEPPADAADESYEYDYGYDYDYGEGYDESGDYEGSEVAHATDDFPLSSAASEGFDARGVRKEHEGRSARGARRAHNERKAPQSSFPASAPADTGEYEGGDSELPPQYDSDVLTPDTYEQDSQRIYDFRQPVVNTETWFVALGAELAGNGGMKAFLAEHAEDLRGAVIINLDALGAGEISFIENEGMYKPVKGSSRMKRYVRKASAALGLSVGSGTMQWRETASSVAARRGCQTMHLAGLKDGKPAYFGEADDVIDNVSEKTLLRNADFVTELLQSI